MRNFAFGFLAGAFWMGIKTGNIQFNIVRKEPVGATESSDETQGPAEAEVVTS